MHIRVKAAVPWDGRGGANTFPVRKYNSRTFHLKVRRSRLFWFFQRSPQKNVGGDSARIPFVEHASRESRVALPPKGRLRQYAYWKANYILHTLAFQREFHAIIYLFKKIIPHILQGISCPTYIHIPLKSISHAT